MYNESSGAVNEIETCPNQVSESTSGLFEESIATISDAYVRLGHTLGWRFLSGPRATLAPTTEVGLITLNPGGSFDPPEHPRESSEAGSAYLVESWVGHEAGAAPLQRQIQALLGSLAEHLGSDATLERFMTEQVLSAHFIPFRSPRFADLPHRAESVAFGKVLWTSILGRWQPRLLLTIDTEAFASLQSVLLQQPGNRVLETRRFDTGWGRYQADAVRIARTTYGTTVTLARLPHLSTFKLFSRDACTPYLKDFLAYIARATESHAHVTLDRTFV